MTKMFNLFQNISILLQHLFPGASVSLLQTYNMNCDSLFLDIGSGFGKPNFHAAMQVGCISKGIEVVPARVEFCKDFFFENLEEPGFYHNLDRDITQKFEHEVSSQLLGNLMKGNFGISYTNHKTLLTNYKSNISLINLLRGEGITTNNKTNNSLFIKKPKAHKHQVDAIKDTKEELKQQKDYLYSVTLNPQNDDFYFKDIGPYSRTSISCAVNYWDRNNYQKILAEYLSSNTLSKVHNHKTEHLKLIGCGRNKKETECIKSCLVDDIKLRFGCPHFLESFQVSYSEISQYILNSLDKIIQSKYFSTAKEQELLLKVRNFNFSTIKNRSFFEIIPFLDNTYLINLISFVDTSEKCLTSYIDFDLVSKGGFIPKKLLKKNSDSLLKVISVPDARALLQELEGKEDFVTSAENQQILKELLQTLVFNHKVDWFNRISFHSEDATKCDSYFHCVESTESKNTSRNKNAEFAHFTHIYAYNKLMSRSCRESIAKILNQTNFKVLAWYSNPVLTEKAGLKNIEFVCKFPMQSTSTEKFHVYIYVKKQW